MEKVRLGLNLVWLFHLILKPLSGNNISNTITNIKTDVTRIFIVNKEM